jgi:hypothetical protein
MVIMTLIMYRMSSTGVKLRVMGLFMIHPAMTKKGMTNTLEGGREGGREGSVNRKIIRPSTSYAQNNQSKKERK